MHMELSHQASPLHQLGAEDEGAAGAAHGAASGGASLVHREDGPHEGDAEKGSVLASGRSAQREHVARRVAQ